MSTQSDTKGSYTIMEAAKLTGLPETTLRFYEKIGLIGPIHRDASSKHRVYREEDINYVISIACLNSTGLSIDDMRTYLGNANRGEAAAREQIALLEAQGRRLAEEERLIALRQKYLRTKAAYWKAVASKDAILAGEMSEQALGIAKELKTRREL